MIRNMFLKKAVLVLLVTVCPILLCAQDTPPEKPVVKDTIATEVSIKDNHKEVEWAPAPVNTDIIDMKVLSVTPKDGDRFIAGSANGSGEGGIVVTNTIDTENKAEFECVDPEPGYGKEYKTYHDGKFKTEGEGGTTPVWSAIAQASVVEVLSIDPAIATVCVGSTLTFKIETEPPGKYDLVSIVTQGCKLVNYDKKNGEAKILFNAASEKVDEPAIVKAVCGTSSVTAECLVVKVDYVTATPTVIKVRESSTCDAEPYPAGAPWPDGKPEWRKRRVLPKSNAPHNKWHVGGVGDSITPTFSKYGRWRVEAECGNRESTTVDVIGIEIGNPQDKVYLKDWFDLPYEGWAPTDFSWYSIEPGLVDLDQIPSSKVRITGVACTNDEKEVTEIGATYGEGDDKVEDSIKTEIHVTVPHSATCEVKQGDNVVATITEPNEPATFVLTSENVKTFTLDNQDTPLDILEWKKRDFIYTILDQHGDPLKETSENKIKHYIYESAKLGDFFNDNIEALCKMKKDGGSTSMRLKPARNSSREIPDDFHWDLKGSTLSDPNNSERFDPRIEDNKILFSIKNHKWFSQIGRNSKDVVAKAVVCNNNGYFEFFNVKRKIDDQGQMTDEIISFQIRLVYTITLLQAEGQ